MACFDKIARGGLRPFFDWISQHADATTLWRMKNHSFAITANLLVGVECFAKVIPQITPRIYDLSQIHPRPVVAYSDAEWTPPEHPPLAPGRGLG